MQPSSKRVGPQVSSTKLDVQGSSFHMAEAHTPRLFDDDCMALGLEEPGERCRGEMAENMNQVFNKWFHMSSTRGGGVAKAFVAADAGLISCKRQATTAVAAFQRLAKANEQQFRKESSYVLQSLATKAVEGSQEYEELQVALEEATLDKLSAVQAKTNAQFATMLEDAMQSIKIVE
eukprot:GDKH01003209.1.p1 GENE.GDKH01003209.1~~GDKH01003209.1.p1  ORF type:complete len:177 (+),score=24.14 GDKH01003209.1:346-876(+)